MLLALEPAVALELGTDRMPEPAAGVSMNSGSFLVGLLPRTGSQYDR